MTIEKSDPVGTPATPRFAALRSCAAPRSPMCPIVPRPPRGPSLPRMLRDTRGATAVEFGLVSDPIDSDGIQLLQNCATTAKQAFVANDSNGLIAAFNQIAASIGALRIRQ